ncbi:MAG: TIGR01457 family HAD-type hydrolase [Candidatus Pristimantibacillus lignocellulolyticus]|uniref:Acid sugar phosphatase n=1 Tax=Candidatus Pristimantibacillus lignocellulolyticus TaxID=2994561 RepID=A0A9J6ZCS6_9BACL|nr:MAG: TIGR01457 family HAD-type hydrolase [Candidatus Pristimantibacillus lignocellulolyticus]
MTAMHNKYKALLIDLDGTMYHGDSPIEGASQLITYLQEHNWLYRFVTNNSSATPEQVSDRLNAMGIFAKPEHICTSAQATAHYITEQNSPQKPKVFMIGEHGLRTALEDAGIEITDENPDYVVQGIDKSFNYEKATKAITLIRAGATSIMTNPDLLLPANGGLIPGAGSIGAMLQASSGKQPIVIGKPSSILVQYALSQLGVEAHEALVVGDNMSTDIAAGVHSGCGTVLLYTGLTNANNKSYYTEQAGCDAEYIFETIQDFQRFLGND